MFYLGWGLKGEVGGKVAVAAAANMAVLSIVLLEGVNNRTGENPKLEMEMEMEMKMVMRKWRCKAGTEHLCFFVSLSLFYP